MAGVIRGDNFQGTLLYVQRVKKNDKQHCEITIQELRKHISRDIMMSTQSLPDERMAGKLKIDNKLMFKSSLKLEITDVWIYSVPLTTAIQRKPFIHSFIVFKTVNPSKNYKEMWWSLEKFTDYIVLHQSRTKSDVRDFKWNTKSQEYVKRIKDLSKIKEEIKSKSQGTLQDLLETILKEQVIIEPYHLYLSNCQKFAAFIFNKINKEGVMWKAPVGGVTFKSFFKYCYAKILKMNQARIGKHATNEDFLFRNNEGRRIALKAIISGKLCDLENLKHLPTERLVDQINDPDCQGYTLLEWAEAFKRHDIIIYLKEMGATINNDYRYHQNVFFIGLQYWDSTEGKFPIEAFQGVDYHGVNGMNDSVLHLALYGMDSKDNRTEIIEKLLDEKCNVDAVNKRGQTPLHIAAMVKCSSQTLEKIIQKSLEVDKTLIDKGDKNGLTPLHYAIYTHSKKKTRLLLKMGAKTNVVTKDEVGRRTPLHLAAKDWNDCPSDIIEKFAETCHNINELDKQKFTALQWALESKHEKISQLLVNNGASIAMESCFDTLHLTPIFLASKWPTIPVTLAREIIQEWKDKINNTDKFGYTPLHWTLKIGSLEMSNFLLEYGANSSKTTGDDNEDTVLHLIARFRNTKDKRCIDLLKRLCKFERPITESQCQDGETQGAAENGSTITARPLIERRNNKGCSPLHTAVESNNLFAVSEFLILGADVNSKISHVRKEDTNGQHGMTSLHLAIRNPRVSLEVVERLLKEKNVDIEINDSCGYTPLFWALKTKLKEKTEFLLKNDANVNVDFNKIDDKNKHLMSTPLHLASKWQEFSPDSFKNLMEKCDNIDAKDQYGYTPLHNALSFRTKTHAEMLLDHGANVKINTNENYTLLHLLAKNWSDCQKDLIDKLLEKFGGEKSAIINTVDKKSGYTALHWAIQSKSVDQVDLFLEHGADVTKATEKDQYTPLHLLAIKWSDCPQRVIEALLKKGADINAQDRQEYTALHKAIQVKSINIVKYLLDQKKIQVNIPEKGSTPLHLVAKKWKECSQDLIEKLLEKGAQINAQDSQGYTPLHLAIEAKSKRVTEKLLQPHLNQQIDFGLKTNKELYTPLHMLAKNWNDCPQDLIETFLKMCPDLNAQDDQGYTPLDWAIFAHPMYKIFKEKGAKTNYIA